MKKVSFHTATEEIASVDIPTRFDDLDKDSFIYLCVLYERISKGEMSASTAIATLTLYLLGLSVKPSQLHEGHYESIVRISELLTPFFCPDDWQMTDNPLACIQCNGVEYHSAPFGFATLTAMQYLNLTTAIQYLKKDMDERHACEVLSHVYTPEGGYDERSTESVAEFFEEVPVFARRMILQWVMRSLSQLTSGKFDLFNTLVDFTSLFMPSSGDEQENTSDSTFYDIMMQIAGERVFGDFEHVKRTPVIDLFRYMQIKARQGEQLDKKTKE